MTLPRFTKLLRGNKKFKRRSQFLHLGAAACLVCFIYMAGRTTSASAQKKNGDHPFHIMKQLSTSSESFLSTVEYLYAKYGKEIADFRPSMRSWCQSTKSCKFCDLEAEMLYMLVREVKPKHVFEMAPNKGYSSHWILNALHHNDKTTRLQSVDIHNTSVKHMQSVFKARWDFTLGDYQDLLKSRKLPLHDGTFDFVLIDALHTEEFSRAYCQKILNAHPNRAVVAIHDISANEYGGGRESAEVYKFMAFAASRIQNVFTMSPYVMPNLNFPLGLQKGMSQMNQIRSKYDVVRKCDPSKDFVAGDASTSDSCSNMIHDFLYFEEGSSPTIFFELSPAA